MITLLVVTPRAAELVVQRQEELGYDDLIFYGSADTETPRDFLLQLHVAVANVGGRKAVLSRLDREELQDAAGRAIRPLGMPWPLASQMYRQTMSYRIEHGRMDRVFNNEIGGPPLTLEADDVVTLRFRCRRGIDWSPRWTVEEIRRLIESLDRPSSGVGSARSTVGREGGHRPIHDSDSDGEAGRVRGSAPCLTNDLTVRPAIPPQVIELEWGSGWAGLCRGSCHAAHRILAYGDPLK